MERICIPETTLGFAGWLMAKIRVDPTEVNGTGGPDYPRLVIPLKLDLNPLRDDKQRYIILSAQCSLILSEGGVKIADAVVGFDPHMFTFQGDTCIYNLEFPLDHYRISRIEDKRKGDLGLTLDARFLIALYGAGQQFDRFLTEFQNPPVRLPLMVPQSHWVGKVLPSLGYGKVKVLELPTASDVVGEGSEKSLEELEHAQEYLSKGDYDKTVEHCRNAIDPIKDALPKLKNTINSETKYEWAQDIATATYDWLDKVYKRTRELSSKPHHLPSVGHFSKHEAEAVMLMTTAPVAFVARYSKQNEGST
jgi:hypothetical protein